MKRAVAAVIAGLPALSAAGMANAQAAQPPKPGPEVQKMAQFAGSWKFEGEDKASPFDPAGRFSGSDTCEWLAGGFQVVCRSEGTGPSGKFTGMELMAWAPEEKVYTSTMVQASPTAFTFRAEASFAGGPWTLIWEGKMTKTK